MAQILQSKNLATKFQIMVEIAAHQPNVQQKDIAPRLGITSQAVSEYIRELIKDGWLSSEGRSRYKVTKEGVDWILQMSRQLHSYAWSVSKGRLGFKRCLLPKQNREKIRGVKGMELIGVNSVHEVMKSCFKIHVECQLPVVH